MKPTIPPMHNIGQAENYVPHDDLDAPIDYYARPSRQQSGEWGRWCAWGLIIAAAIALVKGCL